MRQHLSDPRARVALTAVVLAAVMIAAVAALVALNFLVLHGFAANCADGYAVATGEPPCLPDWNGAASSLWTVAGSLTVALAALLALVRGRRDARVQLAAR